MPRFPVQEFSVLSCLNPHCWRLRIFRVLDFISTLYRECKAAWLSKFQKHLRFLFVKLHRDPFAWAPCQSEEFHKKTQSYSKLTKTPDR